VIRTRFDAIRARFEVPRKCAGFEACRWFWLTAQLLGAIYVNSVIIVGYIATIVISTVCKENISDVDEDDFLRSTAAVAVTVITSVCVLNKLAIPYLLWIDVSNYHIVKKPTQEKQIVQ